MVKGRVLQHGALPIDFEGKILFILKLFLDPWILSGFFAALIASMSWMAAMTKLELSYAYPFTSLSFVLVLLLSSLFFHEAITLPKIIGLSLIIAGVIVSSQK
jgi:drug/metabolite transporter (DMT)-like permease